MSYSQSDEQLSNLVFISMYEKPFKEDDGRV